MLVSRIIHYCRRNGFRVTLRRAWTRTVQALVHHRIFLYTTDLAACPAPPTEMKEGLRLEQASAEANISDRDKKALLEYWDAKEKQKQITERFAKGATLWMIKDGGRLAAFGWTMRGATIEPPFIPVEPDDVHFFDFEVFPAWRGRGVNPALVEQILCHVAQAGARRALVEVHEWNHAQLRSLAKTRFKMYGKARRRFFFGRWRVEKEQERPALQ